MFGRIWASTFSALSSRHPTCSRELPLRRSSEFRFVDLFYLFVKIEKLITLEQIMHHILVCRNSVLLEVDERALKYLKKKEEHWEQCYVDNFQRIFKHDIKYCPSLLRSPHYKLQYMHCCSSKEICCNCLHVNLVNLYILLTALLCDVTLLDSLPLSPLIPFAT